MPHVVGRSPSGGLIYEREDGSRFEIPRGSVDRLGLEVPEAAAAPDDFSGPVSDPASFGVPGGAVREVGGELPPFHRAIPEDNPVVDVQVDPEPLPQPPGQPEAPPNAGQPSPEELGIDPKKVAAAEGVEETPEQAGQAQTTRVSASRPVSSRGALQQADRAADRVSIGGANVVEDEARGAQEVAEAGRETLDASEAVGRRKAEIEGFEELKKAEVDRAAAERAAEIQKEFVEEAQQQMQRVQEAVEIANTPVDPERLWNEASAPRKVSAALGAFLGGLLIPTTGRNPAMEILERQVDRDVKAQIQNQRNAQQNVANEQNMLQLMEDRLGDKMAAVDATKMAKYAWIRQQVEKKLQEATKQLPEGVRQGEVTQKLAAMRHDILDKEQDLRKTVNDRLMNILTTDFQNRLGLHQASRGQEAFELSQVPRGVGGGPAEEGIDFKDIKSPLTGQVIAEFSEDAPDSSVKKFREEYNANVDAANTLGEVMHLMRVHAPELRDLGPSLVKSPKFKEIENLYNQYILLKTKRLQGSRPSDFDLKFIRKALRKPTLLSGPVQNVYERELEELAKMQERRFRSAPVQNGKEAAAFAGSEIRRLREKAPVQSREEGDTTFDYREMAKDDVELSPKTGLAALSQFVFDMKENPNSAGLSFHKKFADKALNAVKEGGSPLEVRRAREMKAEYERTLARAKARGPQEADKEQEREKAFEQGVENLGFSGAL